MGDDLIKSGALSKKIVEFFLVHGKEEEEEEREEESAICSEKQTEAMSPLFLGVDQLWQLWGGEGRGKKEGMLNITSLDRVGCPGR